MEGGGEGGEGGGGELMKVIKVSFEWNETRIKETN